MPTLVLPRVFSAKRPPGVREASRPPRTAARITRTNLLLVAALAMGATDLACTLAYLTNIGMVELNPIARQMIRIGGADQLVMFKLFTMALSSGCIYLIRRHPKAEWCAWFCAGVMLWLTLHWVHYNKIAPDLTPDFAVLACHAEVANTDGWVTAAN